MTGRSRDNSQRFLFGDSPIERALTIVDTIEPDAAEVALASSLPAGLRPGTSSWSFPGWRGMIYAPNASPTDLARFGLAAYARHAWMRTVGLDRTFYALISIREAADLAALVPDGFRFLIKAHQSVTRPDADGRGTTFGDTGRLRDSGIANARFLDAAYARDTIVAPSVEGFGDRIGPILFQFPPLEMGPGSRVGGIERFLDLLETFLGGLPRGPLYAMEMRQREFFLGSVAQRFAAVLREHRIVHSFAVHPTLPTAAGQARIMASHGWAIASQPALVVRWLLGHGQGYDEAKTRYEPFDRIVDPDPGTRSEVWALIQAAVEANVPSWVIANNKAEGSAPLTLRSLLCR